MEGNGGGSPDGNFRGLGGLGVPKRERRGLGRETLLTVGGPDQDRDRGGGERYPDRDRGRERFDPRARGDRGGDPREFDRKRDRGDWGPRDGDRYYLPLLSLLAFVLLSLLAQRSCGERRKIVTPHNKEGGACCGKNEEEMEEVVVEEKEQGEDEEDELDENVEDDEGGGREGGGGELGCSSGRQSWRERCASLSVRPHLFSRTFGGRGGGGRFERIRMCTARLVSGAGWGEV